MTRSRGCCRRLSVATQIWTPSATPAWRRVHEHSEPRNKELGTRHEVGTEGWSTNSAGSAPWYTAPRREPELYLLLADYREGRLDPAEVRLGDLPEDATDDMRKVAGCVNLLIGLRRSAGEDRPLPFSERFAAAQLGWGENRLRARRAIKALCDAGVIRCDEPLPRRGQPYGTKTYAEPLLASAGAVERESVEVEPVVPFEPEHELTDDGVVGGAVFAERRHPSFASGDGTDISHLTNGIGESGGD